MYDFEWHKMHGFKTEASARRILPIIREFHAYESVLDVGCGDGIWLKASQDLGCAANKGVDGEWTDFSRILIPKQDLTIRDLSQRFALGERYDLAMSLEVAEHVTPSSSEIFVKNLTAHSDMVLFGAAIPYQGGFRHVNEQWQSFWKNKFAAEGYRHFDVVRPQVWDEDNIHFWYKQNILLYVKESRADLIAKVEDYIDSHNIDEYPVDMVHPSMYEAIASYDQIAFKPLMRRLPMRVMQKSKAILMRKT